ncbi:MAG: site-2 protease family protein [Candidatus Promineifilaceae bacterium]
MSRSFRLLTIQGIDIRLHFTFPLILLWAAYQFGSVFGSLNGALFGILAVSLLFLLVTLHELGHSFAARRYGVPVKQIILSPIGGVAQLQRMPDEPVQELVIAIAGPAVNALMAFVIAAIGFTLGITGFALVNTFLDAGSATLPALVSYVFISNLFLAAFNLIPAFPMDGGRILRSLFAMRMDYAKATTIAAIIGRVAAVLLGIYGLFNGGIFLIFIALFIFTAAGQEAQQARVKHTLNQFSVQQAYSPSAYRLSSLYTLEQARNLTAYTGQVSFPVVDGDRLAGYLTRGQLDAALRSYPAYTPVSSVMDRSVKPVTLQTSLFTVQKRLVEEARDALPVIEDGGRYLGLISSAHIAQLFRQEQTPPIVIGPRNA